MKYTELLLLLLPSLYVSAVYAEALDLTQSTALDWAEKSSGGQLAACFGVAPTADTTELVQLMRKQYGIRLSTNDDRHVFFLSAGQQPQGARLRLTSGNIDRFRRIIEVHAVLLTPDKASTAREALATKVIEADTEIVIAPKKEIVPIESIPVAVSSQSRGNPTVLLPLGKLPPGRWWVKVTLAAEDAAAKSEPKVDTFMVRDHRETQDGAKPGQTTGVTGLQRPDSPSALGGMGQ